MNLFTSNYLRKGNSQNSKKVCLFSFATTWPTILVYIPTHFGASSKIQRGMHFSNSWWALTDFLSTMLCKIYCHFSIRKISLTRLDSIYGRYPNDKCWYFDPSMHDYPSKKALIPQAIEKDKCTAFIPCSKQDQLELAELYSQVRYWNWKKPTEKEREQLGGQLGKKQMDQSGR